MGDDGVQFPLVDGRRSTQRTSRDVFAHAAAAVDAGLAAEIRAEQHWRKTYPRYLRRLTELAAASPESGVAIARAGLARVHEVFEFVTGGSARPLSAALAAPPSPPLETRTIAGRGSRPAALVVPYRGRDLRDADLVRALTDWQDRGLVEPAVVTSLLRLVDDPGLLDLSGRWFVVFGAGAEMAPTEHLLAWGADVVAIDLPLPGLCQRLEQLAEQGSGRMHQPVDATGRAGADLLRDAPRVLAWLEGFDQPVVAGNYTYADGATFARVSVAVDALIAGLRRLRADTGVVCLATPTDVFAVPEQVASETRRRAGRPGVLANLTHHLTGRRLLVPAYRRSLQTDAGTHVGIADGLVVQQGPNYALAKRIQRWRALVTHADGAFGAVQVAPPTRTRSVLKRRLLAAAYAGAPMFGVETFEPATSRAVMAALLVAGLRDAEAAPPHRPLPEHDLVEAAVHGGLWRVRWEPRTALPLAVLRGAGALLRRH